MITLPHSKKIDTWTAVTIFALVMFGVVMIYSASVVVGYHLVGDEKYFFKRQLFFSVIGLLAMAFFANVDYRVWQKWGQYMLIATFVLLISVFFLSKGEVNGAHRWVTLGPITFQPSEFAKLTFIMYMSSWLVERRDALHDMQKTFYPYLAMMTAVSILMLRQPDFGTLMIILIGGITVYFVAGMTWKQIGVGVALLSIAVGFIVLGSPYRRARLMTFLGTSENASKSDYHVNNIAIAIGSGGLDGLGFGESRQKRRYLPEPQTDSIFAVIAEELGFVWSTAIIGAFVWLAYRGYRISQRAVDMYGRLVAAGITAWFSMQAFINLGSMLHIVPLVGVPLPFLSYGGTNLIATLIAAGVLLSISRYQRAETSVIKRGPQIRKGRP